jgi:hypothetical protein
MLARGRRRIVALKRGHEVRLNSRLLSTCQAGRGPRHAADLSPANLLDTFRIRFGLLVSRKVQPVGESRLSGGMSGGWYADRRAFFASWADYTLLRSKPENPWVR